MDVMPVQGDGWRQLLKICGMQVWLDVSCAGLSTRPYGLIDMWDFKVVAVPGVRATS